MDRRAASAVGLVVTVVVVGGVVVIANAPLLAATTGIAWGVAAGIRAGNLGRDRSIDGPDWWTASTVSVALLVAVPGLAYLGLPSGLQVALGLALLGVGSAGASLGQARERALHSGATRESS